MQFLLRTVTNSMSWDPSWVFYIWRSNNESAFVVVHSIRLIVVLPIKVIFTVWENVLISVLKLHKYHFFAKSGKSRTILDILQNNLRVYFIYFAMIEIHFLAELFHWILVFDKIKVFWFYKNLTVKLMANSKMTSWRGHMTYCCFVKRH